MNTVSSKQPEHNGNVSTSRHTCEKVSEWTCISCYTWNFTAVHTGSLSHFIVALTHTDALCNVWSADCLCLHFSRKLQQERMILLPQISRSKEGAWGGGGWFLSPPVCFDCSQQSTRWSTWLTFGKKNNKNCSFTNLDCGKLWPWSQISRINSNMIFIIKTVFVSFVLARRFTPSLSAARSFGCSHGSHGHKNPLLQLSL